MRKSLSTDEAAHLLGTPRETIVAYAETGRLPYKLRGGVMRFQRADIHDLHDGDDRARYDHEDIPFNPETAA